MSNFTGNTKENHSVTKHLDFLLLDIVTLIVSFILAYVLKFRNFGFITSEDWRGILLVVCLIDFAVVLFTAPYSSILRRGSSDELLQALKQALQNLVCCSLALYAMKCGPTFSRVVIALTYIFYWIFTTCVRNWWKKVICARLSLPNAGKPIFVIGNRENMSQLLRSINSGFLLEYSVSGICITDGEPGEKVTTQMDLIDSHGGVKVTYLEFENNTTLDAVPEYVLKHHIGEVFIGVSPSEIPDRVYEILRENGKEIHLEIGPMVGFVPADQYISTVGTFKTLTIADHLLDGQQMEYIAVKRLLDIFFGLLGMLILLPLTLVVKLCYLCNGDTKPIFYTQTRVGLKGKPFKLYKFRSMVCNADEVLKELLKDPAYRQEWEEKQKFDHDPRITKIGNILRKTSLDEIPQFLNVLKGDMSVIGPRPLVVGELELHNGLQMYNDVKPGITGWWGCNGRSNTTYDERLSLEYYYVEHCSLYLDVLCFVKTIGVVFQKKGAK